MNKYRAQPLGSCGACTTALLSQFDDLKVVYGHSSDAITPMKTVNPRRREGAMLQRRGGDRRNVAWMAVGAAGLVVGSMIGGDAGTIVAVTGGVIGLIGLFRFLQ